MTELSSLFEQIFHSERNFKARVDHLRALNAKIQDLELKLEQTRDELYTKKGELAVKNSKLADVEMEVKLLHLRKEILTAQRKEETETRKEIADDYQAMVRELTATKEHFRGKLVEFSQCYDLHGFGLKHREEENKKKIVLLQDELILLETEMVEVESYLEDIGKLQEELANAENALNREREREKDLQTIKLKQEAEIQELKNRKISNAQEFNSTDLKRLQSELDACKNSPEERRCQDLNKELSDLQRKCYHQQMKLQTARQSRIAAPSIARNQYSTQQQHPLPELEASKGCDEVEVIDLVEDEWLEAGGLEKFDDESDDYDYLDDDVFMEAECDVDEVEQSSYLDRPIGVGTRSEEQKLEVTRTGNQRRTLSSAGTKYSMDFQRRTQQFPQIPSNRSAQSHTTEHHKQPYCKPQGSQPWTATPKRTRSMDHSGALSLSSPFPYSITRKRPGDSIFKAPKEQNQNSPKRTKKVRFQY